MPSSFFVFGFRGYVFLFPVHYKIRFPFLVSVFLISCASSLCIFIDRVRLSVFVVVSFSSPLLCCIYYFGSGFMFRSF